MGDTIAFSGSASDPSRAPCPPSALSLEALVQHCPSNCHTHTVQTWTGVASGSFAAPDHEYPSYLEPRADRDRRQRGSATTTTATRSADRRTELRVVAVRSPARRQQRERDDAVHTGGHPWVHEHAERAVAAGAERHDLRLLGWSDGGAQTHTITANAPATYTATYTPQAAAAATPPPSSQDSPLAYWRLGETSRNHGRRCRGNSRTGSYLNTPLEPAGSAGRATPTPRSPSTARAST